ncbi:hypothetical protein ABZ769_35445 [Streptomyces olivoreticuli]
MTATAARPKAMPATFQSEQALREAVDTVFADALAYALTPAPARRPGIDLPTVDELIAQAGIVTGPPPATAPAFRSVITPAATTAARWSGRAAWWLLTTTAYGTALLLRGVLTTAWHLLTGPRNGQPVRASEFLDATSDHITTRGWTRFALESEHGVCVIGAQRQLMRSGLGTSQDADRAAAYLRQATGARNIPRWNDRITHTDTAIHAGLREAAALARAAGD